jgi:hypothetical protein
MNAQDVLAANSNQDMLGHLDVAGIGNVLKDGAPLPKDALSDLASGLMDAIGKGLEAVQGLGIG